MDSPSNSSPPPLPPTPSLFISPPPHQNPNTLQFSISQQFLQDRHNSDQDSLSQGMFTSPSPIFRLHSFTKRKKGKPNLKKQQAIEKKYQTLKDNLKPIPFSPSIILYFSKHENLLRRLGLWDFVNIDFDKTVRTDLIAQLVASYDSKARCSYVNGVRIMVNRADLGRAFKLVVKKEKGGSGVGEGGEDDWKLSDEEIGFIENFVSYWMLLHEEDTWMMPSEVLNWMKVIKEGFPQKVDWAGLLWFMVEKELTQGERLGDCYYASHLQYLIMHQREEVVLADEPDKVELDGEEKEVIVGVVNEGCLQPECTNQVQEEVDFGIESEKVELVKEENKVEEVDVGVESERVDFVEEENNAKEVDLGVESKRVDLVEEVNKAETGEGSLEVDCLIDIQKKDAHVPKRLNIELTLGEATGTEVVEEEEKVHDDVMMDLEEGTENDADDDNPGQWQLDAENTVSDHTLERCNMEIGNGLFNYEDINEEAEDIEEGDEGAEDTFDILENHDTLVGDGLTVNFLQANKLSFSSHEQFCDQPGIGLLASRNDMPHTNLAGPSFYGNGGKRPIEHMSDDSLNGNNKRLRIDGPWDNEPPNFAMCMEGMQQFITRAKMMYEAREHSLEQSNMHQQILLNELHKRDSLIEHLHKCRSEDMQKKGEEIYRLERELSVMGNLLDGYREALKGTQKAFADYKKDFALPEESIYKDAGPGGLMLTTEEIEKRRLKQQEDHRLNCLMLEQKAKEAEEGYSHQFATFVEKICKLDSRLVGLENDIIELKNSSRNRKGPETEQPIFSKTSMPDNFEGSENEHYISEETNMLEQPASSETNMTDNCEGIENEEPASGEPGIIEQPASSKTDMSDTCVAENEQPVSGETSRPDNNQGSEDEQN